MPKRTVNMKREIITILAILISTIELKRLEYVFVIQIHSYYTKEENNGINDTRVAYIICSRRLRKNGNMVNIRDYILEYTRTLIYQN